MLVLRDFQENDAGRLAELANNENVSRYLVDTFPFPYTRQDAEWWVKTGCSLAGTVAKVIEYKREFVGCIGLNPQTGWKAHSAEIGYWLGEPYWGLGLATRALQQMSDFAFAGLAFKKLYAPVLHENKQSMHVLERCGFKLEGVLRQDVFKNGQYYDIHQYAKLCP